MIKLLKINVVALLLYWLLALSTELLAIPPDYATPVWPSAGVALGFVIAYGRRVYPGIFLGALLANLSTSLMQGITLDFGQVLFAASIAVGATLQSALAKYALKQLHVLPHQLVSGASVALFLIMAGPVSCLLNSINGATMLVLFDIVPAQLWVSNWLVWWVGDSVGALILTPIVLRFIDYSKQVEVRWQFFLVSLIFLVLVMVSFFVVRNLEQASRKELLVDKGQQLKTILTFNANAIIGVHNALTHFFSASDFVSKQEFDLFSKPLLDRHKAISSVQWIPSGGESTYIFPSQAERVFELPSVRPLLNSKTVSLLRADDTSYSLNYVIISELNTPSRPNDSGVVAVLFDMQSILQASVIDKELLDSVRILDVSNPGGAVLLLGNGFKTFKSEWSSNFQFLNKALKMELMPTPELIARVSSWQSYIVLIGGLFCIAVLEAILLTTTTRQRFIEQQVELKTRELAVAKLDAEKASMAKTEFLASMSHELRTPLNSVIGFTRRVLKRSSQDLDERSLDALRIVERNGHHLLGLINDLLDLTKVESGRLELAIDQVYLDKLMLEIVEQLRPAAEEKNSQMILNCQYGEAVEGDAMRIRQIMINLVSNAIKFTEQGVITLVTEKSRFADREGVLLKVIDTGIGIHKEDFEKLFNKFQRIGSASHLNPEGTGLGLALVKEMCEMHHGWVSVESGEGKGAVFSVWLPKNQT